MYNREYEYVIAIAREGNLSKAAVSLGVSQPALTRFLQREEADIGTKLFQKVGGQMVLTYAGECYVSHIQEILSLQTKMLTTIQDISKEEKGRLRIGVPAIRRPYTIFSVIPLFREKYPSIDITMNENGSNQLEEMLDDLKLDVIAVNIVKQKDNFIYHKVADEEFVLAVPASSSLLELAQVTEGRKYPVIHPEQLKSESFILLNSSHRIRQFADRLFTTQKIDYKTSMVARSLESALEAVSVNLGVTFTPEIPLKYVRNSQNIRYLSLDMTGNNYEFDLVLRKGTYVTPSMQDFIDIFTQNYTKEMQGYYHE